MVIFLILALVIISILLVVSVCQLLDWRRDTKKEKEEEKKAPQEEQYDPFASYEDNCQYMEEEDRRKAIKADLAAIAKFSRNDQLGPRFIHWFGECIRNNLSMVSETEAIAVYRIWMLSSGGLDRFMSLDDIMAALDMADFTLCNYCRTLRRTAENVMANIIDNLCFPSDESLKEYSLRSLPLESRNAFAFPTHWEPFNPDYIEDFCQNYPENNKEEVMVLVEDTACGSSRLVGPCLFLPEKPDNAKIFGSSVEVEYIGPGFYYLCTDDKDNPKLYGIVTKHACMMSGYSEEDIDESERVVAWSKLDLGVPDIFRSAGRGE